MSELLVKVVYGLPTTLGATEKKRGDRLRYSVVYRCYMDL